MGKMTKCGTGRGRKGREDEEMRNCGTGRGRKVDGR